MVKQPAPEPTEFQMFNEDFPALPGTSTSASATPASNGAYSKTPTSNVANSLQTPTLNALNGRTPTSNVANSKTSQAASATSVTGNHIDAASKVEVRPMARSRLIRLGICISSLEELLL